MQQPTIGNLFAGIEGFEVGFENAGGRTAWQVEWRRIKGKFRATINKNAPADAGAVVRALLKGSHKSGLVETHRCDKHTMHSPRETKDAANMLTEALLS